MGSWQSDPLDRVIHSTVRYVTGNIFLLSNNKNNTGINIAIS